MANQKNKDKSSQAKVTGNPISDSNNPIMSLKEETIKWTLSIVCSLLIYLVIAVFVQNVYHPDVKLLMEEINSKFATAAANPKPVESLLFKLGIAILIPGSLGFYILLSKIKLAKKIGKEPIYLLLSGLCIAFFIALFYFDFSALNPFGIGSGNKPQNDRDPLGLTNFDFYFDGIFMGKYILLYLVFIVPLIVSLFFIGFKKYKWEQRKLFRITFSIIGYAVVLWAIIAVILMNTYEFPYTIENKYDFSAVYYSMTQVFSGVPMLVAGFTNTYGLYPHFLNLLFQLTGLSVLKFSLVMSLLTGLAFLFNFYVLKRFVSNMVILFFGFATVLFFPYLDFKLLCHFDSLFALFPIRYIVPSSLAFLATIYFNNRSAKIYWITYIITALLILWNPEMGIVSYLSWLITNIYADFYNDGKVDVKKIFFHVMAAIGTVTVIFSVYELVVYLFYKSWPDLSLLFNPILFFGKYGVGNLSMSLVHPWNITVIILLLGFLYSLVRLYKNEVTVKSSIVLLISLISLGYFFYFEGRSHDSNFAFSSSFSLILLTILGDDLWSVVKNNKILFLNLLFVIFLAVISFSFIEIVYNTDPFVSLIYQNENKDKQAQEQQNVLSNEEFILSNSKPGEKIFVFVGRKDQALYFDNSKRVSEFNPGFIDMFLRSDLIRLESTFRDSANSVFILPDQNTYSYLSRSVATLAATYEFAASNQMMYLCNKRKTVIPSKTFFRNNEQMVIHRKYNDDTSGWALRINDAMGINTNKLSPEFSVAALFYSKPQLFEHAAIVGNILDSKGFAIGNETNTSKYYIGINNYGALIDMPFDHWYYCVLNVYPDHFTVYTNGVAQFSRYLTNPLDKLNDKTMIGNMSGFHHYFGAIAEVAVLNKALDTTEIQQTWEDIKQQTLK